MLGKVGKAKTRRTAGPNEMTTRSRLSVRQQSVRQQSDLKDRVNDKLTLIASQQPMRQLRKTRRCDKKLF